MKNLLSLFDKTGHWSTAFRKHGFFEYCLDIQNGFDITSIDSVEFCFDNFPDIDGILAAVPCTDFASSGAQYWSEKDEDGRTAASMELVNIVLRLVDLYLPEDPDYLEEMDPTFFWAIENSVGRLTKLFPHIGKPTYFQPWEYAGYLNISDKDHNELDRIRRKDAIGVTKEEALFVINCNAYTKKTGLWGDFTMPEKDPIDPVRCCKAGSPLMMFGGKRTSTKNIRSVTPAGFASAFAKANKDHKPTV